MNIYNFQSRVSDWLIECFGVDIAHDKAERAHRFLEEAIELYQACGMTKEHALSLVDYVYGRPVGNLSQEIGGVAVTLAALCEANEESLNHSAVAELCRIESPEIIEKIRAKHATKPKLSALPGMNIE